VGSPLFAGNCRAQINPSMPLRVMTYNILDGGENREASILQVIRSCNPDVVVLQEVYTAEFLKSLAQSLGMDSFLATGTRRRKVALLSRLPIRKPTSVHTRFPIWRNFVDAEIEYEPGRLFRIVGVHPMANLSILFELWRWWEAKYVIRYIQNYRTEPCLIAGDFNAIAPGDRIAIGALPLWLKLIIYSQGNRVYHFSIRAFLSAGFTDCFRLKNPADAGFTLPPPTPNARLDYMFVNVRMAPHLKKCWVVREPDVVVRASDHYPVIAEFSFAN
jgi:exodeoxyribonuclease III